MCRLAWLYTDLIIFGKAINPYPVLVLLCSILGTICTWPTLRHALILSCTCLAKSIVLYLNCPVFSLPSPFCIMFSIICFGIGLALDNVSTCCMSYLPSLVLTIFYTSLTLTQYMLLQMKCLAVNIWTTINTISLIIQRGNYYMSKYSAITYSTNVIAIHKWFCPQKWSGFLQSYPV